MPYRLFVPKGYDSRTPYPLVLWLHGAGGSGVDNMRQISGDQIPGTRIWTSAENQAKHPAFVLVPQAARCWDATGYSANDCRVSPTIGNTLSEPLSEVMEILKSLEAEFNIDRARLYIAGQSMGGFGVWNFITKVPDLFAAAIILCGGGDPKLAPRAKDIPIWSFQGDADDPRFVSSNRAMIEAIRKVDGKPLYTEYAGAGHDIWNRVFKEPNLVDWLFSKRK
jgi:predicted peptidase